MNRTVLACVLVLLIATSAPPALSGPGRSIVVLIDRVYAVPGSLVNVTILLLGGFPEARSVTVRLAAGGSVIYSAKLPAAGSVTATLPAPSRQGVYTIDVLVNASEVVALARASEPLPVVDESTWSEPLLLCFVWHNHQGVNVMPDGAFHGPWAFAHVYERQFKPYYPEGAYSLHATLLEKHPGVNATVNWSPSLLWQWLYAMRFGYYDSLRSTYVSPNSSEVEAVRSLLERLRLLAASGRMEVLTSFFNHPIPGYVVERFEWGLEALEEELEWGLAVTQLAFNLTPRGAWIPEMFFSMKLVEIMEGVGIAYTILDARHHLAAARGDAGTPYEPYLLRAGERELVVFFRDSDLSDFISFGVDPGSEAEASALARRFVASILARKLEYPEARVVVIAADGENWLFGNSLKALFFDRVLSHVESCYPLLRAVTLSEALRAAQPRRALSWIPTNSWAGGDWVWTARAENQVQWSLIGEAGEQYAMIKRLCQDAGIRAAAAFSLFMALNSDVIHREYTMVAHTRAWSTQVELVCRLGAREAEKLLRKRLTPSLLELSVAADCCACAPSPTESLPQIVAASTVAAAAVAIVRRQAKKRGS